MTIRQLLLDGIEETKKAVHASKTIIRFVFTQWHLSILERMYYLILPSPTPSFLMSVSHRHNVTIYITEA
jgi:hypothetical protein